MPDVPPREKRRASAGIGSPPCLVAKGNRVRHSIATARASHHRQPHSGQFRRAGRLRPCERPPRSSMRIKGTQSRRARGGVHPRMKQDWLRTLKLSLGSPRPWQALSKAHRLAFLPQGSHKVCAGHPAGRADQREQRRCHRQRSRSARAFGQMRSAQHRPIQAIILIAAIHLVNISTWFEDVSCG